jgi:NhaC family Na+:H+ antiporter
VLGVATLSYAPWAFFCLISPLMTLLYAWGNIRIARLP